MQYYSTAGIPQREKLDYWNGLTSENLLRMEVNAMEKGNFDGELYWQDVGPFLLPKRLLQPPNCGAHGPTFPRPMNGFFS